MSVAELKKVLQRKMDEVYRLRQEISKREGGYAWASGLRL